VAKQPFNRVIQRLRRSLGRPVDGPADMELLSRYAQAREEQAFTTLVERYGGLVWGVCRRVAGQDTDADDAFQATFLTLAAKAGSPFLRESLAGWLYRVAYRTASRARLQAARRRHMEQAAAGRLDRADTTPDIRELQRALDEELSRLPERFRSPVLLCCLQDQTTDEAAQQLGWSFTTVKGRLQRGREMLRQRLQKRGIALSASVLATVLAEGTGGAAPTPLVTSTVQAALHGTMTPAVAALVKGASRAMLWTKIKFAVALVAGMVIAAGGISLSRLGTDGATALAVPVPAEAEAVKSSKPVVKNGLEVVVTPARTKFEVGQHPVLKVTLTNRSDKLMRLYDYEHIRWNYKSSWRCDGGIPWQSSEWTNQRGFGTRPVLTADLEPGKSVTQTVTLQGPYVCKEQEQSVAPRDELFVGRYRIATTLRFAAPEGDAQKKGNFWTGEIVTDPVEVVIGDPPQASKPAVKDGLEIVVTPTDARFPAGQQPTLKFTYTNRGKNEFALHSINFAVIKSYRCVDKKTGDVWQAGPWKYERTPVPETAFVEPGKSVTRTETLPGPFEGVDENRLIEPYQELPPGTYLVTAHVVFQRPLKIRGLPRAPFWTGEITTNPVEVKVVDPKAEAKPINEAAALALAQKAAERALDKEWAPLVGEKFPNDSGVYPQHIGPWLAGWKPTTTTSGDGWTFRHKTSKDGGFDVDVQVDVSKTGKVTIRKAAVYYSPD
jgi:RNA polymerase sigma factor (sigma-70 family)